MRGSQQKRVIVFSNRLIRVTVNSTKYPIILLNAVAGGQNWLETGAQDCLGLGKAPLAGEGKASSRCLASGKLRRSASWACAKLIKKAWRPTNQPSHLGRLSRELKPYQNIQTAAWGACVGQGSWAREPPLFPVAGVKDEGQRVLRTMRSSLAVHPFLLCWQWPLKMADVPAPYYYDSLSFQDLRRGQYFNRPISPKNKKWLKLVSKPLEGNTGPLLSI